MRLFHFLGSVTFAIILIAATALMVVAGTFIEAKTGSHRFAALFTYSSPLFSVLLCGFFINILFAALRRWPFKKRHIPFLITHLGLLMVIGSTLVKQMYGLQGVMLLTEGQGSQAVFLPHTHVIRIEKQGDNGIIAAEIPLNKNSHPDLPGVKVRVAKQFSHSKERMVSWIKGDEGEILGLKPFPVVDAKALEGEIPPATRVRFHPEAAPWEVYAIRTDDAERTLQRLYKQYHSTEVPQAPALAFVEDANGDTLAAAFDPEGTVHIEQFPAEKADRIFIFNEGFGGYGVQYTIPFPTSITIETTLAKIFTPLPPTTMLEDNKPLVVLEISEGGTKETIALNYDRYANGFYTPALDGRYRLRFQPQHVELPYRLRLRQARQVSYANSAQPFSYECDLVVTDKMRSVVEEKTICMNEVYESADGYRFYLASISPADETAVKRVQLAVNNDPTKYLLLIPGTFIVGIGIVLLFGRSFFSKN